MTSQLHRFQCLILSCQVQKRHQKRCSCDVIVVTLVLTCPFKFSDLPTALQLTVLDPTALVPHKRVDSMTATTSLTIIIFTSHKINMVHRRKSSERIYIQIFPNHQIPQNFLLIAQSKQLKRNEK